jgi:hypothetical protein
MSPLPAGRSGAQLDRTTTVTSVLWLVLAFSYGCGDASDAQGDSAGSGGGSAGTAGAAGTAIGGSSGISARAGSGGLAGSAPPSSGTGAGQAGGTSQTSGDCAARTETSHCVTARGEIDGQAFDITCLADTGGLRIYDVINRAWSMSCSDAATSIEAAVSIPEQDPGPFAYGLADVTDDSVVDLELRRNSILAIAISRLDALAITGEVQMDAGSGTPIVGTFEGTWSAGSDPRCTPETCASATVTGSYRSLFNF